jgi:hypothetical protein
MKNPGTSRSLVVLALLVGVRLAAAQVLQPPFTTDYSVVDLGAVPGLPAPAGGLTFLPGDPDTILIGGAANTFSGDVFSIGVTRDAGQHVTGFTGTAAFVSDANGISFGGIDGGLSFGPGGVLFYTSYNDNSLGQIKPGSTTPDRRDALTPLGITSSVGALAFVPAGFPGAGRMKLVQYNSPGHWYDVTLDAPAANGTYPIASATLKATIGFGPEGVIYVSAGNPQIAADSVIVSEYSGGSVSVYEVDANGDPVVATRRPFITMLTGAEGAVIDPLTGDFLFSTFGGGNRVIVVRGFIAPTTTTTSSTSTTTTSTTTTAAPTTSTTTTVPTTTTSSAVPTTSTTTTIPTTSTTITVPTTTLLPTTTSSTSTTSSSTTTSTAVVPTTTSTSSSSSTTAAPSTTTTLPAGSCAATPAGATFDSIACRLAALVEETKSESALGALQAKLQGTLGKAVDRTESARGQCASDETKAASSRLKQVGRQLIQYSHRLRGRSARKKVKNDALLEHLAGTADAIQRDVKSLRSVLRCPEDAA